LQVDFYSTKRDCTVDLLDIIGRITPTTRALLVVHYFGFPQGIHELREICKRHQIALIEDCAHVLCGDIDGQPLGSFGDAAIFSWRKFLPIYDGGELVINRPGPLEAIELANETALFTLKVGLNLVDRTMRYAEGRSFRAAYDGLRFVENMFRR